MYINNSLLCLQSWEVAVELLRRLLVRCQGRSSLIHSDLPLRYSFLLMCGVVRGVCGVDVCVKVAVACMGMVACACVCVTAAAVAKGLSITLTFR